MCERSGRAPFLRLRESDGRNEEAGSGTGGLWVAWVANHDARELGAEQLIQRVHQVVFAGEVEAETVESQLGQRSIRRGIHHQPERVSRVERAQRRPQLAGVVHSALVTLTGHTVVS